MHFGISSLIAFHNLELSYSSATIVQGKREQIPNIVRSRDRALTMLKNSIRILNLQPIQTNSVALSLNTCLYHDRRAQNHVSHERVISIRSDTQVSHTSICHSSESCLQVVPSVLPTPRV